MAWDHGSNWSGILDDIKENETYAIVSSSRWLMKKQTTKCWEHFKLVCCCRDGKPNYKHNASTAEKILASQRVLEWFT